MKIEELTNFLITKLKDLEEMFLITQDNHDYLASINRKEYKYKEVKIYLPDISMFIRITNYNNLDHNMMNNLFSFITYLILHPYICHFSPLILCIHKNQLLWNEYYSYDLENIQNSLTRFHNDFINNYHKFCSQNLFIFNNNFYIIYENDIDIIKQLSKYINTDNHVYILDSLENSYQLQDFNTIFRFTTENIDVLKNMLEIYSKTYKPIVLTGAKLEIDIDNKYIKLYITDLIGSKIIIAFININNLDGLHRTLGQYYDVLYEFNKLVIDNFGHIINNSLFSDINVWLIDNIIFMYKDNDVNYWFNKMIVELTL